MFPSVPGRLSYRARGALASGFRKDRSSGGWPYVPAVSQWHYSGKGVTVLYRALQSPVGTVQFGDKCYCHLPFLHQSGHFRSHTTVSYPPQLSIQVPKALEAYLDFTELKFEILTKSDPCCYWCAHENFNFVMKYPFLWSPIQIPRRHRPFHNPLFACLHKGQFIINCR